MENENIEPNLVPSMRQQLPNATAVLVLGILSLVFGCCYGLGLPMAIIALVLAKSSMGQYKLAPDKYDGYGNLKAGRVCAIIGLCISGVYAVVIIAYFIVVGSLFTYSPDLWKGF